MSTLKSHISALIDAAESGPVWVPTDFAQLGSRDAVDKTLQRMVQAGGSCGASIVAYMIGPRPK